MMMFGAAVAASVVLTACGGGGSSSDSAEPSTPVVPFDAPPISEAQKAEFLNAINAVRAQGRECGKYGYMPAVPPVTWNDALYRAAYEHTVDMAMTGVLSHSGSGTSSDWTAQVLGLDRGSTLTEREGVNGIDITYKILGENIGRGYPNTAAIINGWLKSDGHCHVLMNSYYTNMGMAHIQDWWTIDFSN